jgi:hypothetical protein
MAFRALSVPLERTDTILLGTQGQVEVPDKIWTNLILDFTSHYVLLSQYLSSFPQRHICYYRTRLNKISLFSYFCYYKSHVRWVLCHHGMTCPQVADGGDALQL